MGAVRKLLRNWWLVSLTVAAVAAVVLCLGLPLAWPRLGAGWIRLSLLGLVVGTWSVLALLRGLAANRASALIARSLVEQQVETGEQRALAKRMGEALAQLKSSSGNTKSYLYSRPWYVIIGPPGGGKTTALANSGLRFPFSDLKLGGAGGTRNLDFFFADQAILVDTAGRYTSQDNGDARDRDGWQAFLDLLRRTRPLQPVNGVIVAMPLDLLSRSGVAEIDRHAEIIRRRVAELQIGLQSAPPIYVMFTKSDLVAGFAEYFDDLLVDGRSAVLGSTFPWDPDVALNAAQVTHAFDELTESLAQRMSGRLQEERDPRRRSLILGFPSQMAALRARIVRLLEGAFPNEGPQAPSIPLRGFYFTSGVQEGAPLDRILSSVAEVYDAPQPRIAGAGRAFFINRLLTDVVFAEAGLTRAAPALVAKRRAAIGLSFATIGVASLLMAALLVASFFANRAWQHDLEAEAREIAGMAHRVGADHPMVTASDAGLDAVEPVLARLRNLPGGYGEGAAGFRIRLRTWLQSHDLTLATRGAYQQGLQRLLLPRLVLRLEAGLKDKSDPVGLYERLKVYLLLGAQRVGEPDTVQAWAADEYRRIAFTDGDEARARLNLDTADLLSDAKFGKAWVGGAVVNRKELVDEARGTILATPLADRAYALMLQEAAGTGSPWKGADKLDPGARLAFRDPDAVARVTVPYLYTRDGYSNLYRKAMGGLAKRIEREAWVLADDQNKVSMTTQMQSLKADVARKYAQEYEKAWERVLTMLQPADYFADRNALNALKPPRSALAVLLREVRRNTRLTDTAGAGAIAAVKKGLFNRQPKIAVVADLSGAEGGFDAAREIETHFTALNAYSDAGVLTFAESVRAAVEASEAAKDTASLLPADASAAQAKFRDAMRALERSVGDAPGALQGFVSQATGQANQTGATVSQSAVNGQYASAALPDCHAATEGVYPFVAKASADATLAKVQPSLGQGGTLDRFINDSLIAGDLIDRSGPIWRWRQESPIAAGFDPSSAEQFMKASHIHDLLLNGLTFKLQAVQFGGAATSAEFTQGGTTRTFQAGPASPVDVVWTAGGAYPARVLLHAGASEIPFSAEGPWALFRLFESGKSANVDPTRFNVTFAEGAASVTFQVSLRSEPNPFGRGFWSFRCPAAV